MHLVEGVLRKELLEIVTDRLPNEAAGLILPSGKVIELTNHAEEPHHAFMMEKRDIVNALAGIEEGDLDRVTVWHSHPSGGVGPSRIDLQQKTRFTYHLVVALVNDDLVPTWY